MQRLVVVGNVERKKERIVCGSDPDMPREKWKCRKSVSLKRKKREVRVRAEGFMVVDEGKEKTAGRSLYALRQRDACR